MIELLNTDCLEYMAKQPDNAFELAIVDPPYGLGFGTFNRTNKDSAGNRYKANKYHHDDWDQAIPDDLYFQELLRVSKNQIVWGGNYFPYLWTKPCRGFIYWHKGNPVPNFSDGELAWTSFDRPAKQFDFRYYGGLEGKTSAEDKIHPTQKPVKLYEWLFANYHNAGGGGCSAGHTSRIWQHSDRSPQDEGGPGCVRDKPAVLPGNYETVQ